MRILRASFTSLFIAAIAAVGTASASDDLLRTLITEPEQRITLAKRQAVLAEAMSRSVCMLDLGLDARRHSAILANAKRAFDNTLNGLRDSDDALGLLMVETDQQVLDHHAPVAANWSDVSKALNVMQLTGRYEAPFSARIYTGSARFSGRVETLATSIIAAHAGGFLPAAETTRAPDLHQLQMLTQRAGRELCLIALGWQSAESRADLADTLALIDRAERDFSDAGTGDIVLSDAFRAWATLKALPARAAAGQTVTLEEIERFTQETDRLLTVPEEVQRADSTL